MGNLTAPERHRRHHSKVSIGLVALVAGNACAACGGSLPRPALTAVRREDYVAVLQAPGVPIVEIVPGRPRGVRDALWVDGAWEWTGARFRWRSGGWIDGSALPRGARYAPWAVVRRREDGQLFFAPSSFLGPGGTPLQAPAFLSRAEATPGEPAAENQLERPEARPEREPEGGGGPPRRRGRVEPSAR